MTIFRKLIFRITMGGSYIGNTFLIVAPVLWFQDYFDTVVFGVAGFTLGDINLVMGMRDEL